MRDGRSVSGHRVALLLALLATLLACASPPTVADASVDAASAQDVVSDTPPDVQTTRRWACPEGWVAYARGGCGPAVLLCAPDGGAAVGACDGVDIAHPRRLELPDGGMTTSVYRKTDGTLGGPWHEAGEAGGAPSPTWVPDAGISACPVDWQRRDDGTCDARLRADCPAGSAPLPGGACTATARVDCPVGEYADPGAEAVGASVLHVRAGAAAEGADGSTAHPYPTLASATRAASPDAWLLLANGTYTDALDVTTRLHVLGRCAAAVTLASTTGAGAWAHGGAASLDARDVTIRPAAEGVRASEGAAVRLRRVRVESATRAGVIADDPTSRIDAEHVVVVNTRVLPDGTYGAGLAASRGGTLIASRVYVSDSEAFGAVAADGGSRVTLTDVVVRAAETRSTGRFGSGFFVRSASLTATRAVLSGHQQHGAAGTDGASSIELTDARIEQTLLRPGGIFAAGLAGYGGAQVRASRVAVVDTRGHGVLVSGAGTRAELSDCVVRDTRARGDSNPASGVAVVQDATATLTRTRVESSRDNGLLVDLNGACALDGSVIRDSTREPTDNTASGVLARRGGRVTATGTLVVDNRNAGVRAVGTGVSVSITDSAVRGTRLPIGTGLVASSGASLTVTRTHVDRNGFTGVLAGATGRAEVLDSALTGTVTPDPLALGVGAAAYRGGTLVLTRCVLADNEGAGVAIGNQGSPAGTPTSTVTLTDSLVRDHRSQPRGGEGGGVYVDSGARIDIARTVFLRNLDIGVSVYEPGSVATLDDVLVVDMAPRRWGFGMGVASAAGAHVTFSRLAVQGSHAAAVMAALTDSGPELGSVVDGEHLFVRGVRPQVVRVIPTTAPVAYGLHAGTGCTLSARRFVVDDGGYGFFHSLATMTLREGVVTGQRDAAGASNGASDTHPLSLDGVSLEGNIHDDIVRDVELPEASLPAPAAPCETPGAC